MAVELSVRKGVKIDRKMVRRNASAILKKLGLAECEVSIFLTGDSDMRNLNKTFRNIDAPTDVLSFSMDEPFLLGDVVISVERARSQAKRLGIGFDEEIKRLLAHAILHLVGYDHARGLGEARKMREKEEEILRGPGRVKGGALRQGRRFPLFGGIPVGTKAAEMIKRARLIKKFEDDFIRGGKILPYEQSLKMFADMWNQGQRLGVLPLKDSLEGIEFDIKVARILNGMPAAIPPAKGGRGEPKRSLGRAGKYKRPYLAIKFSAGAPTGHPSGNQPGHPCEAWVWRVGWVGLGRAENFNSCLKKY